MHHARHISDGKHEGIPVYAIKVHGGVEKQLHTLTLTLDGRKGPASYTGLFTLGETTLLLLNRRLGEIQSHSGHFREENVSCLYQK
jgi:hypothetical protein